MSKISDSLINKQSHAPNGFDDSSAPEIKVEEDNSDAWREVVEQREEREADAREAHFAPSEGF